MADHRQSTWRTLPNWRLWQLLCLWAVAGLVLVGVVAFDIWRVGEFAIAVPGAPSLTGALRFLVAAAPVLPLAVAAIVVIPVGVVASTVWWLWARVRAPRRSA